MRKVFKLMFFGTVVLTLSTLVVYVHHYFMYRVQFRVVDQLVAIIDGDDGQVEMATREFSMTSLTAVDDDDDNEEDHDNDNDNDDRENDQDSSQTSDSMNVDGNRQVGGDNPEESPPTEGDYPEKSPPIEGHNPEESPSVGGDNSEESPYVKVDNPEESSSVEGNNPQEPSSVVGVNPEESPSVGGDNPEESPSVGGVNFEESPSVGGDNPEESPSVGGDNPEEYSVGDDSPAEPPLDRSNALNNAGSCANKFIASYNESCRSRLRPRPENVPHGWRQRLKVDEKALCECIPRELLGPSSYFTDKKRSMSSVNESLQTGDRNMIGGRWFPTRCVARHRVAVIVPYRNRTEHLRTLVYALHPFLQRQQLDYTIFVVEQIAPSVFNRASLLNVGFLEAKAIGNFDCYIFHDVDMVPKDDRNFYTCSRTPRHLGRFRGTLSYRYRKYFGGIVAINGKQFKQVNGFSNKFYGWGGEDDDFRQRIFAKKLSVAPRFPQCVAEYATAEHRRDPDNPTAKNKDAGMRFRPKHYKREGLGTTKYRVDNHDKLLLYTKISVTLRPA